MAQIRRFGVPLWAILGAMAFALLVPLLFVYLGAVILLDARHFVAGAVPVEARVLRVDAERDGDDLFHRPVFAFTTPDGRAAEAPLETASTRRMARDAAVTVLYNPERPEAVRLTGFWHLYGGGAITLGLGLLAEIAFAIALWKLVLRAPAFGPPGAFADGLPGARGISEARRAELRDRLRDRR